MKLSSDAQVVLLLCSHLGISPDAESQPLTLQEWNDLASSIHASTWKRPGLLLDHSAEEIAAELGIGAAEGERIGRLLERGGVLAIELERLESLGIWVLTRADDAYPQRLRDRLREKAPTVLHGAGNQRLLGQPGLAVVGSRNVDQEGQDCAAWLGEACASAGWVVYSGGARGVDRTAMVAAFGQDGHVVGVLGDSLERAVRSPEERAALGDGRLALITPYHPKKGFSVGAAMGRNKLIYALADYAVVVASEAQSGGTWAGAVEALKHQWIPVFSRNGADAPEGNRLLLQHGARPFPFPASCPPARLPTWLAERAEAATPAQLF